MVRTRRIALRPGLTGPITLLLTLATLIALVGVLIVATSRTTHAQIPPPSGAEQALRASVVDLAQRTYSRFDDIALLRVEAVTWNDGCLGSAEEGELCAQALVDDWVLWVWIDRSVFAARYHTDLDGTDVRFAEGIILGRKIPDEPVPPGATLRTNGAPAPLPDAGSGGLAPEALLSGNGATGAWLGAAVAAVLFALASTAGRFAWRARSR